VSAQRRRATDPRAARLRWTLLASFVAVLLVAARLLPLTDWMHAFEAWVQGKGAWGGVLYGLVYVLGALLFVPAWIMTIGAGLVFGAFWGTVVVSLSSTVGAAAAFLIARYLARARVEAFAKRSDRFAAIEAAIREKGWRVVFLLRLSPLVPYNLSNYLYGLTPLRFWPYVLASWAGMLPATVLYVSLGAAGHAATGGRARARSPLEWTLIGAGLLATATVTVMVTRAARRQLARLRVEEE
jgi:uncharacterized membrane protein YdjX (TVP38/TMEM64 family)